MKNAKTILMTTAIFIILMFIVFGSGFLLKRANAQAPIRLPGVAPLGQGLRTITVSGSGQASVQPDRAVIQIGVRTEDAEAAQALSKNNEQMQALVDALKKGGVQAADIQTQGLQLQPCYEDQPSSQGEGPKLSGFTAMNTVEVRVREIDQVGDLLDAATAAGANTIQGIRFETEDPSEASGQARKVAMEDAQHKAAQLAQLVGAELGQVVAVQEGGSLPLPLFGGGAVDAQAAEVPIEPGSQTISVDVQVTWDLAAAEESGGGASGTAAPANTPSATP